MAEKVNILQFMVIRPASLPDPASILRSYIHDDTFQKTGFGDADLFSEGSHSAIGKLVYTSVFCDGAGLLARSSAIDLTSTISILLMLLQTLPYYDAPCPNPGKGDGRVLESLRARSFVVAGSRIYLIPDRLADVPAPLVPVLPDVLAAARTAVAVSSPTTFDKKSLLDAFRTALGVPTIEEVVFENGSRSGAFADTRRQLFDTLYLLYILRRRLSIQLESLIDGLRALHILEAVAIDEFLERLRQQGQVGPTDQPLFDALTAAFPSLRTWTFGALPAGLPLIATAANLEVHLHATPVVHPLFARLHRFRQPFNAIRPLGIGDLKVVKQWLTGYKVGEIAHIDNVLLGEKKTRVHRHLEKTEEVFSLSSEQQDETQSDVQTTDRFEMKRETDNVVKSDFNVNANANFGLSYENMGYKILTGATAGFAYTRSQFDQAKTAANFAREVVNKAVVRVQSRVSKQRTTTKLFEAEETNTHTFKNEPPSTEHISGIYRWVDKEYSAQLFNYGKRMMFEFVLPEPASFLVESRLRAYESQIDFPRPPAKPALLGLPEWLQQMPASSITETNYRRLAERYDLSALPPYPTPTKVADLVEVGKQKGEFAENRIAGVGTYTARAYTCELNAVGYRVARFIISGHATFSNAGLSVNLPVGTIGSGNYNPQTRFFNRMDVSLAGDVMMALADENQIDYTFRTPTEYIVNGHRIATEDVTLVLGFWDIAAFSLSFRVELQLTAGDLADWQTAVKNRIVRAEQAKVDEANGELTRAYNAQMTTYRNRVGELRAVAVNDLLQGQSEAANRDVILRELKRHCLSVLTKEFDSVLADDVLTDLEAMSSRTVAAQSRRFVVQELPNAALPVEVTGDFDVATEDVNFPVVDLDQAKVKGRYIQFLEQAFEWQLLSYVLYPYFWATPPKWIELMNRRDATDPFLTAFLQAGSVRILVAVTPAYDEAVLHYLATGEPWEGGPAPVIGDPLYIPLYEELKRQQDDLNNATPEGKPWAFTLPTSLVYVENSNTPLPTIT